jgi:murein DD-endopeptidase MepM/ murein hydrolase activator NlpD
MNRPDVAIAQRPGVDALSSRQDAGSAAPGERDRLAQIAAEFESMLMLEMIKQMRQSVLGEAGEGEDGLGAGTFTSTIDGELASYLARAGGVGLQPMMLDAWDRQRGGADRTPSLVGPRPSADRSLEVSAPSTGRVPDEPLSLHMPARVSSSYGWRADPFGGHAKFHGGIDLAAAYGTAVPAAAGGTVVTAAEQGAYGLTVVVRHPGGYESRYAHLSSLSVNVGDQIAGGTVLGRVGSTGRSTAPHLHFEVTRAGQRVDPERFVRNLTSDTKGQ